ncbi:MAG: PhoH family protein [Alphaproteobacteria bacterium]|nr:PhoH family protein [Alphaproteobacteria bacterium]
MNSIPQGDVAVEPRVIDFDDNRLLPELFGEHDKNLVRIETQLGISLINRGNQIALTGPKDSVDLAEAGLKRLYSRLKGGERIEDADVDAALRMAGQPTDLFGEQEPVIRTRRRQIAPRTPTQAAYIDAIYGHDLVFGLGPAGTGKTYLAVCMAVSMYLAGQVERIILSRPAVEAGERLGFLPGDMKEKVDPYLRPIYDALYDTLPADQVSRKLENGDIEVAPLAFMRGRTLKNAFVLLDEAQNTTAMQMKMFLTRLGENSRMVITGDLSQIDLPPGQISGLAEAVHTLSDVKGIEMIRFDASDVVRHPLVARIVQAYDARDAAKSGETKR